MNPRRFVLVDDDQDVTEFLARGLTQMGHQVRAFDSSPNALRSIENDPPDWVVSNIMMPELDGVELTAQLRENPKLEGLGILILSGKIYEADRSRALAAGADGFLSKSRSRAAEILQSIINFASARMKLKFWGCRGTIPVPGPETVKYGGNTSCVSLTFPDGHIFVFDAGTGIKPLADHLSRSGQKKVTGTIFFSHPHWDHINYIPFFSPLFVPGNQFTLVGCPVRTMGIEQLVGNQMGGVHFPITPREFGARILYRDVGEGRFKFGPAEVETMFLCHPGKCLGYSVLFGGKKICYVTDNELFPENSDMYSAAYERRLGAFVANADILITDTTYFDEEYESKIGWGHSCVSSVCGLAHRASVKSLYLFHHEPEQTDHDLERKLQLGTKLLQSWDSQTVLRLAKAREELILSHLD